MIRSSSTVYSFLGIQKHYYWFRQHIWCYDIISLATTQMSKLCSHNDKSFFYVGPFVDYAKTFRDVLDRKANNFKD